MPLANLFTTRTTAGGFSGARTIYGWNVVETGASTAEIELRDGSASGAIIERIKLVSGQSIGENYPVPVRCSVGDLTLVITSGAVQVNVKHA